MPANIACILKLKADLWIMKALFMPLKLCRKQKQTFSYMTASSLIPVSWGSLWISACNHHLNRKNLHVPWKFIMKDFFIIFAEKDITFTYTSNLSSSQPNKQISFLRKKTTLFKWWKQVVSYCDLKHNPTQWVTYLNM